MPNGFIGKAPTIYLTDVTATHEEAKRSGEQISSSAPSRNTPRRDAHRLPHEPHEARTGKFTTGKGSSSNIVADTAEYEEISRRISQIDDKMGECLYRVALEIEEMCRTTYILPEAVPRCMGISDAIKTSLGEFRSLTEEAVSIANGFARDITNIGK